MTLQFEVFPFGTEAELRSRFQDFLDREAYEHGSGVYRGTLASKRLAGLTILQTKTYATREDAENVLAELCGKRGPAIAVPVKQVIPKVRNQIHLMEKRVRAKSIALHREKHDTLPQKKQEIIHRAFERVANRAKPRKTCKNCDSTINLKYLTVEQPACPVCGNEKLILTHNLAQAYERLPHRTQEIEHHIAELQADITRLHETGEQDGAFWLVGGECSP